MLRIVLKPQEPTSQKRHKTPCCIMGHHDQHRANGLAFTPVRGTCVIVSFLFFAERELPRVARHGRGIDLLNCSTYIINVARACKKVA